MFSCAHFSARVAIRMGTASPQPPYGTGFTCGCLALAEVGVGEAALATVRVADAAVCRQVAAGEDTGRGGRPLAVTLLSVRLGCWIRNWGRWSRVLMPFQVRRVPCLF